jgi:GWxTD domain-containing protein
MIKQFIYHLLFILCLSFEISTGGVSYAQTILNSGSDKEIIIHPQFELFHSLDSVSELHFKINNKELLYTKRDGQNFTANCLIYYNLLPTYNSREILESDSLKFFDINNVNENHFLIGKFDIPVIYGKSFFLKITVVDLNRNVNVTNIISIDKTNELTRQNFLVTPKSSNIPFFNNYLQLKDTVRIHYKKKKAQKLYVSYYNRDFPLPPPPFSNAEQSPFEYKPDQLFILHLSKDGVVDFIPSKKGFYHFQLDTSSHDGLTLFLFSDNFPEIKKTEDMLYPMRFITSKDEYDSIEMDNNLKNSIEKFWLSTTNYEKEKTRKTIQKYYTRAKKANEYFTSYVEGWRSDRGMIYLIYGKPSSIYKAEYYEAWTYSDVMASDSYTFSFVKVMNPFTDNDYKLDRSQTYRQEWFLAVDEWRQGKNYTPDE